MERILLFIIIALFISQFFAPILANKIKDRFRELGFEMESKTQWSLLNVSGFWREAYKLNNKASDSVIYKYLRIYYAWWFVAIITFIGYIGASD